MNRWLLLILFIGLYTNRICAGGIGINSTKNPSDTSISRKANVYILSIGIHTYNMKSCKVQMSFKNSVTDARNIAEYIEQQAQFIEGNKEKVVIEDTSATSDNILKALNNIIEKSKPNDYFILCFTGRTDLYTSPNGQKEIYFVPYGSTDICDSATVVNTSISHTKLRGLLQLIQANNQLFISEAGNSEDFGKLFTKGLIDQSPDIASISSKNRVFLVPHKYGLDYVSCQGNMREAGPISYFLQHLPKSVNVFELFGQKDTRNRVVYEVLKQEYECNLYAKPYTNFFFERELVEDLKFYFTKNNTSSKERGAEVFNTAIDKSKLSIGKKYALVVGTNEYKEWTPLNNAVQDAEAIAEELRKGFDFDVQLLRNPVLDTVYSVIQSYAQRMDSNDQLLIYFAGHGDFDEKFFNDGFLVVKNSSAAKNDPYRKTYIQHSALQRIINNLPSRQILVVFDVCYGGTFDDKVSKKTYQVNRTATGNAKEDYINKKLSHNTRVYISSGNKNTVPDGYRGEHSPFAIRFLEALRTRGGISGILTKSRLFSFVEGLDSEPIMGSFGDDEPGSEFILISR